MQMCHVVIGCSVAVLLMIIGLPLASCDSVIIQKRIDPADVDRILDPKRKRPFCNAFTGCGKKRSDESMGTLVELNSEPAVEDLSRKILSETKLWEAIQEARAELLRRRQEQLQLQEGQYATAVERPIPLSITGYRKKRSVIPEGTGNSLLTTSEPQDQSTKTWSR
ncbi:cardioactive peptide isoform X2 [Zootermopsis nevadensis]|uniref:cardioactive peptide isoform X2 n=1 Tax=Zootermopsis nevadensis TaxID=136037 RepID=UPI000B8E3A60|nr:cardioactive peptide isoform X2 [Zootermopsis nevadensis]